MTRSYVIKTKYHLDAVCLYFDKILQCVGFFVVFFSPTEGSRDEESTRGLIMENITIGVLLLFACHRFFIFVK